MNKPIPSWLWPLTPNASLCETNRMKMYVFFTKSGHFHVKHFTRAFSLKKKRQTATRKCKKSQHMSQAVHQVSGYPCFCNMKWLGVLLPPPPPGWDASPLLGSPQHYICQYLFIQLSEERHCEPCPRTQYNVLSQGSNPNYSKPVICSCLNRK